MRPYTLKIKAGETNGYSLQGNYVFIDSVVPATPVIIKSLQHNEQISREQGNETWLTPFKELHISNPSASDITVVLYIGNNTRAGSSKIGGSVQPIGGTDNTASPPNVKVLPSDSLGTQPDVEALAGSVTQVVAANQARKRVHIANLSPSVTLRWGEANVGAARGAPIYPGLILVLESTAPVYVFNPDVASVFISITEEGS